MPTERKNDTFIIGPDGHMDYQPPAPYLSDIGRPCTCQWETLRDPYGPDRRVLIFACCLVHAQEWENRNAH